ncbi:ribonuclease H-like domain-containing protein [Tanacetum coccineum]
MGINCTTATPKHTSTPTISTFNTGPPNLGGPTAGPLPPLGFPPQAQYNPLVYVGPNPPAAYHYTMSSAQPNTTPICLSSQPTLQDPNGGAWNMDTGASSHLNASSTCLSDVFNTCLYSSVSVGDGHPIPITNTGHSVLPTPQGSLHLHNVLITPTIDFITRRVLLRSDSTKDLYLVTFPSPIPQAYLVSQHMWHQRLGHPGSKVLHGTLSRYKARLVANGSTELERVDVDETFSPVIQPRTIQTVLSLAASRHWPIHQLDVKNAFLHGLFLSPKKYAVEIIEKAHMVNYNISRTPIDTQSKLGSDGDPVSDPTLYRSLVALKRILLHVHGTLDYALQLFSYSTTNLVAYSDADWAGCPTTRRSTSGYCVFPGNNLLSWSSKRQPMLSCSSAKAEYRGVANVVVETCWLRNLLCELHTPLSSATLVNRDNVSAVYLSCNPVQHQRTKHIEIDIHFVRDLVAAGQVRVLHVPSRYHFADIFIKGLPSALFEEFRSSLSVRCPLAPTAGGVLSRLNETSI